MSQTKDLPVVATLWPAANTACHFKPCLIQDSAGDSSIWECPHPPERDGRCLYHLAKLTREEWSKLPAPQLSAAEDLDNRCRVALDELILKTEADPLVIVHEFYGFEVPWGFGLPHQKLAKAMKFRYARFHGQATFAMCEISDADFRGAEFFGRADFTNVEFHSPARFNGAHFHKAAEFNSVHFHGEAFFAGTYFHEDCLFSCDNGGFDNYANFNGARFEGHAAFVGFLEERNDYISFSGEPVFHGLTDFCKLSFVNDASLSFTNLSLEKANFYDTDLKPVRFIGVTWSKLNSRLSLWGEVRLLKIDGDPVARKKHGIPDWAWPPQIEKLAENYAQLVLNYEQRREVDSAEDFHIGEMEMRRRKIASGIKQPWLRAIRERCNGFGVYRLSSIYGTSYTHAAWVLACIVLFLSLLFLWTGIAPAPSDKSAQSALAPIQYQLLPDADHPHVALTQWWRDYTKSLLFTLSVATFQKDRSFQPAGPASELLAMLTVIVIGAQAALLLFAVRRRFKR